MDHAEAQRALPDYFAGRLGREDVRALHAHLKDCEACRSHIRLSKAQLDDTRMRPARDLGSPEVQAQIVKNRNLLLQVLALMLFAYFVWKFKR
jgi:predicted anti-sigma-YlaC factor YlaD